MKEIKAPGIIPSKGFLVFLAGSIETGKAVNWQQFVINEMADKDIVILNPRRDDWDSSWVQSIDNLQLREQVEWELRALEVADLILMYFAPGTKSPITLLELGIFADSGRIVVCCPDGFWRKGNVDIVSHRYAAIIAEDLTEMVKLTREISPSSAGPG